VFDITEANPKLGAQLVFTIKKQNDKKPLLVSEIIQTNKRNIMEGYELFAENSALEAPTDEALRVPYYCEENVWRLGVRKRTQQPFGNRYYAVFISNPIKNVPMFQQKAAANGEVSVCWDYHVILLCQQIGDGQASVYDMDSLLPYPCPLDEYLEHSFPYDWPYPFGPMFRVVPLDLFLNNFGSDRSHMRDKNGGWNAPPPIYAPIGQQNNLQEYLRFGKSDGPPESDANTNPVYGRIFTKKKLRAADLSTFP